MAIVLPKIGRVVLREALRLEGKIMGATVMREADNWFVSVQVELAERQVPRIRTGHAVVGVDLGICAAATLSTGEAIASPRPLKAALRRLRIRSRRASRKFKAAKAAAGICGAIPKGTRLPVSKNRTKAARALARLHARVAAVRGDFTHKLTTRLCRENQTVVIEDLHVKGVEQGIGAVYRAPA
jgi:putative transposase